MPREFAEKLLAYEVASGGPAEAADSPGFRVCEKMRGPLCRLMGVGGFHALLSRSLALASTQISWLRELHIKPDGSVEGVTEVAARLDAHAVAEGEVVLVGHLLGLLVILIGPTLTLGLLHAFMELQHKIDEQKLTGADKAEHLQATRPSEFPVPAFGAHDLQPPANAALFHPPEIERQR